MFESNVNVAPSSFPSKLGCIRPRIAAIVAGIVALTLVTSAIAEPRTDPAQPGGRKLTKKSRAHVRAGRKSHKTTHAMAARSGRKADSLRSYSHAKGKAPAAKSNRIHRAKHTAKASKSPAHRAKRAGRNSTAHRRTAPSATNN